MFLKPFSPEPHAGSVLTQTQSVLVPVCSGPSLYWSLSLMDPVCTGVPVPVQLSVCTGPSLNWSQSVLVPVGTGPGLNWYRFGCRSVLVPVWTGPGLYWSRSGCRSVLVLVCTGPRLNWSRSGCRSVAFLARSPSFGAGILPESVLRVRLLISRVFPVGPDGPEPADRVVGSAPPKNRPCVTEISRNVPSACFSFHCLGSCWRFLSSALIKYSSFCYFISSCSAFHWFW